MEVNNNFGVERLLPDKVLHQNLIDTTEDFLNAARANPDLDRENLKDYYSELVVVAYTCGLRPEADELDKKVKATFESWLEPLMGIEKKKEEETDDGES